ncbi:hypothetical protein EB796_015590 [Bugula neritina]|uniref:Uncharacterized protein n=1 Tax=Bugula neritina TaxID=10212 RepID=A0A7J7JJ31_BUGNE|nr:hypothetical protein EB796_015590 [Bugula neritina]
MSTITAKMASGEVNMSLSVDQDEMEPEQRTESTSNDNPDNLVIGSTGSELQTCSESQEPNKHLEDKKPSEEAESSTSLPKRTEFGHRESDQYEEGSGLDVSDSIERSAQHTYDNLALDKEAQLYDPAAAETSTLQADITDQSAEAHADLELNLPQDSTEHDTTTDQANHNTHRELSVTVTNNEIALPSNDWSIVQPMTGDLGYGPIESSDVTINWEQQAVKYRKQGKWQQFSLQLIYWRFS